MAATPVATWGDVRDISAHLVYVGGRVVHASGACACIHSRSLDEQAESAATHRKMMRRARQHTQTNAGTRARTCAHLRSKHQGSTRQRMHECSQRINTFLTPIMATGWPILEVSMELMAAMPPMHMTPEATYETPWMPSMPRPYCQAKVLQRSANS